MSPVFVNTVRASFYRFRPDLGGLRVGREILVWRTVLPQCDCCAGTNAEMVILTGIHDSTPQLSSVLRPLEALVVV